jgi:hypothetical protein
MNQLMRSSNSEFLESANEYLKLLSREKFMGGDAELEFFANYFQTEICLIDMNLGRVDIIKYGSENSKC